MNPSRTQECGIEGCVVLVNVGISRSAGRVPRPLLPASRGKDTTVALVASLLMIFLAIHVLMTPFDRGKLTHAFLVGSSGTNDNWV